MWLFEPTDAFKLRYSFYEKKRRRELKIVLRNLHRYVAAIEQGANPVQLNCGFIHPEGKGVIAIGEEGGPKNLAVTRLYIFPVTEERLLYQLTLGDKRSQQSDINFSHEFVANLDTGTSEFYGSEQDKPGEDQEAVR